MGHTGYEFAVEKDVARSHVRGLPPQAIGKRVDE